MEEIISDLFGTVDIETGLRRYQQAFISVAKKNGKSFLLGGFPLYHLDMEPEIGASVIGIATSVVQSREVYDSAAMLVRRNPMLQKRFKVIDSTKRIVHRDSGNSYSVRSSDGARNDGMRATMGIVDELHKFTRKQDIENWNAMLRATRGKEQPLVITITTAGDPGESQLWLNEYNHAKAVLSGAIEDRRYYAKIYEANPEKIAADPDYWKTVAARLEGNPSHEHFGGWIKDEELERDLKRAETIPDEARGYKRFTLNIGAESESKLFTVAQWSACAGELRPLIDRECFVGVDMSSTTDLTALVLLFPDDSDGTYDVMPFFWCARDRVDSIGAKLGPFSPAFHRWIADGSIATTRGDTVDPKAVVEKILWAKSMFHFDRVYVDPAYGATLMHSLDQEHGMTVVKVHQSMANQSAPLKFFRDVVLNKQLRHGGHQVLKWNASCAATESREDNIRLIKSNRDLATQRIDGISALVNAFSGAMAGSQRSVYDTRGVLSL